jgi:murein DD-endopeptidase MepM/ murein hydrolase activator NlpD
MFSAELSWSHRRHAGRRAAGAALVAVALAGPALAARVAEPEVDVPQAPVSQGDVFLVTLRQLPPGARVDGSWQGRALSFVAVSAIESVALVGVDYRTPPGRYALTLRLRARGRTPDVWRRIVEIAAKDFGVQRLTLPRSMVYLDKPTLARVRREAALLSALWPKRTRETYWRGAFVLPVPGEVTTPFGIGRIINGEPRSAHSGVDLRAALGEEVRATNGARVVLIGDFYFSGRTVVLDHGLGVYSMYFHLSEVRVTLGALVDRGDVVGLAGSTGRSTGPHLHWGVRLAGARVDPFALVRATSAAVATQAGTSDRAQ